LLEAEEENIFPNAKSLKVSIFADLRRILKEEPVMTTPLRELSWQDVIQKSQNRELDRAEIVARLVPIKKWCQFVVDMESTLRREQLCIQTSYQEQLKNGQWSVARPLQLHRNYISHLKNDREREGFRTLITGKMPSRSSYNGKNNLSVIESDDVAMVLERLRASGKTDDTPE